MSNKAFLAVINHFTPLLANIPRVIYAVGGPLWFLLHGDIRKHKIVFGESHFKQRIYEMNFIQNSPFLTDFMIFTGFRLFNGFT